MNVKLFAFAAIAATTAAFGAYDDTTYFFSTKGVDCYADGSQVAVGERYALVWSAGEFAGFNADGTLVNAEDAVVGIFSLATAAGNCPLSSWGVPSSIISKGGNISLWLLDTRVFAADGSVKFSAAEGTTKVASIAGAVKVAADISVAGAVAKAIDGASSTAAATAVPADAKTPVVKSMKVDDAAGLVYVTVGNTEGYLAYDLAGGAKPNDLEAGKAQNPVTGGADEITLIAPKKGDSQFLRVIRK